MRFLVALLRASLFVDKADSELSFSFQGITCIHALHIRLEFAPRKIAIPASRREAPQASYPFSFDHEAGEQVKIEKLPLGLGIIRLELMTSTTSR